MDFPKGFKTTISHIVLFVLGRGFQSAARLDPDVKNEVKEWPEGFSFIMRVMPNGPHMGLIKKNGRLRYQGKSLKSAELEINFKNVDSAFLVFTAQVGTADAYAQHRMSVKGDLTMAMSLIRCLNILEGHLFPAIINRLILKRLPPMPWNKQLVRIYIYLIGIPLGL